MKNRLLHFGTLGGSLVLVILAGATIGWRAAEWISLPIPVVQAQESLQYLPDGPSRYAYDDRFFYDGSSQLEYECIAPSSGNYLTVFGRPGATSQPTLPGGGAAPTLTSITVTSNVAIAIVSGGHGFGDGSVGHGLGTLIAVRGATVSPALNSGASSCPASTGCYSISSIISADAFSFATVGVANGPYTESSLYISTTSARETLAIWSITKHWTVAGLFRRRAPAQQNVAMNKVCANRASYFQ